MRANLQELTKVMRPLSAEEARAHVQRAEAEAGVCPKGFVDAEHDMRSEFWERADALEAASRQHAYG